MLAPSPVQYADVAKRLQGRCGNCVHRTHGAPGRNGLPVLVCRVYEFEITYDARACLDEYRRAAENVPELRGTGKCGRCHHRVPGPLYRGGKSYVCEITGDRTPHDQTACIEYVISQEAKSKTAKDSRLQRERRRQGIPKVGPGQRVVIPVPKVVVLSTPTSCRHCGSTTLWYDDDGWNCPICGWHLWLTNLEPLYGTRPIGDAMPSLSGVLSNEW